MNTLTIGTRAQVIAAPGYPTESFVEVVEVVDATTVRAAQLTASGVWEPEVFTLRRNGKFAQKGGGQWANYLREVTV